MDEPINKQPTNEISCRNNNNYNSIGALAATHADANHTANSVDEHAIETSSDTNPLLDNDDDGESSSFERRDSNETADDNSGDSMAANDECGGINSIIDNDQLAVQWENFVNENHYVWSRDDEKIYEDLCYVTFSSSLPKVHIQQNINISIFV